MLLKSASVILDSFPFGVGVTCLEALAPGVPVVTLPSHQTVPALAAGMLQAIELSGSAANSTSQCSEKRNDYSSLRVDHALIAHNVSRHVQLALLAAQRLAKPTELRQGSCLRPSNRSFCERVTFFRVKVRTMI